MEYTDSSLPDNKSKLELLTKQYEDKRKVYLTLQQEFSARNEKTEIDFEKIEAELDDIQNNIMQLKKLI